MIPVPDIGHVYPKSGLDADLRFDSTPTYVSTGSMFLDGVNDHLDLDGLTLTTSSANYSFSFWFRTVDKTSDHRFFGIQNSGNSDRLNVQITATDIFSYSLVSAGGTSTTFSTSFVNDFENGSWHHAAMVVTSGTGVVLYLDGQLVTASQTMRNVDLSANGLFAVGSDYDGSAGGTLSGCICHFGVWHAALTQAQVKDLMTATTYAEAVTKGGSTPRAYFLLESNATDSVGAITYTTSGSTSGTLTSGAAIVGDRARLPSGLDLTGNQMNAQVFSGRAVAFDGTGGSANDQLLADSYADSSDYFSLSIWFKASAAGLSKGLWTNGPAAEDVEHGLVWFQAGLLRYHYQDGTAQYLMASDYNPDPGIWHHLVATVDGSTASAYDVKIYLDGKLQSASKTTSGATWHASDGLTIGSQYGHAGYWDGSISDCRMFNVELTAAQALELYQNPEQVLPTGVSASALKRFYPLCDYDISGAESLDGLYLQDSSGNGKHLLATGTAMEFAQPTCPQLGLRSSASMCLFNDSNTVTRLNADAAFNCSGAFTYLFWFQTFTANADARLLDANAGAGPVVWIDSADAGYVRVRTQLFFGGSGHTWDTPNNVVPIGEWVHLGVTFAGGDSSEIVYYVNGSSVAVTNPGGTPSGTQGADSGIKDIGGSGSGVVWDGFISEFAIFAGTVLDADAVAAVYQSGIQGFDLLTDSSNYDNSGDLDGWWKIDNPQTNVDLKGSVDATWNNTPSMATIPEGSTAGLSSFGTLTTDRPPFAFAQPPVGNASAVRDANPFAGGFRTPPGAYYGTGAFSITFWFRPTQGSTMTSGMLYKHNSYDGVIIKQTSATNILVDFNGDDNNVTINCASGATMVNQWTMVCAQRIASDSLKVWTRKAGDAAWATATSSTAPGDMTPTDTGVVCNWMGDGGGADFRNNPGAMCAFPRVWHTEALTEAQINALFESGQRMLIGGNT